VTRGSVETIPHHVCSLISVGSLVSAQALKERLYHFGSSGSGTSLQLSISDVCVDPVRALATKMSETGTSLESLLAEPRARHLLNAYRFIRVRGYNNIADPFTNVDVTRKRPLLDRIFDADGGREELREQRLAMQELVSRIDGVDSEFDLWSRCVTTPLDYKHFQVHQSAYYEVVVATAVASVSRVQVYSRKGPRICLRTNRYLHLLGRLKSPISMKGFFINKKRRPQTHSTYSMRGEFHMILKRKICFFHRRTARKAGHTTGFA